MGDYGIVGGIHMEMTMTPEEIKELQEDLRVGAILIAKLTDQCRELEAQLAKAKQHEEQKGFSIIRTPEQKEAHKVYLEGEQKPDPLAIAEKRALARQVEEQELYPEKNIQKPDPDVKEAKKQERERITKDIHSIEFESNSATDFLNKTLYYLKALQEGK